MPLPLHNPSGVDGLAASFQGPADLTFRVASGETVTRGTLVYITSDAEFAAATTSTPRTQVFGVALEDGSAGDLISARFFGVVEVAADSGISAGDAIIRSGSNAGQVAKTAVPGAGTATGHVGTALSATSSGKVLAFIAPSVAQATG